MIYSNDPEASFSFLGMGLPEALILFLVIFLLAFLLKKVSTNDRQIAETQALLDKQASEGRHYRINHDRYIIFAGLSSKEKIELINKVSASNSFDSLIDDVYRDSM